MGCAQSAPAARLQSAPSVLPPAATSMQDTVNELATDFAQLAASTQGDLLAMLQPILARRRAPMLLLSADLLRKLGKLPCFAEVEHDLTPLHDVDVSRGDRIVFISHRWWQPDSPDGASAEKVALVLSLLEAHIQPHKPGGRIYLWWDFASITQKTHALHHACDKGAQILAIPFYLVAVDAMIGWLGVG